MNFAFGILTLIFLVEHALLFFITLSWEVLVVPWIILIMYLSVQYLWPMAASKLKTGFSLVFLLGLLGVLPRDQHAALYILYALFMHFMAWMIGYEGYLGKRPEVRTVNMPRNPRSAWIYTESFWPTVIPAYFAIEATSLRVIAPAGQVIGFTLLVFAFLFWEHGRRLSSSDQPVPGRKRERPIYPLIVSVAMLIGVILLASLPLARVLPVGVDELRARIEGWMERRQESIEEQLANQFGEEEPGGGAQGMEVENRQEQQVGFNEQPELPMTSKLGMAHTEDLYLHIHDPNARAFVETMQIYLRGAAMVDFQENKWYPHFEVGTWYRDDDDRVNDGIITLNERPPFSIRHTVFLNQVRNRTLFAMPGMSHIMMNALYEEAVNCYTFSDSDTLKVAYTVDSAYYTFDRAMELRPRLGEIGEEYLRIPNDPIMPNIAALANTIIDPVSTSPLEKVAAYRNYLRDNYEYTREVRNPAGLPPLQNFLFNEKRGYCDFYATSLTLMLRSQNIPSRLAVGYTGGSYDTDQDLYTFYSDNAHSWTEVYLDELGWTIVDATPPEVSTPTVTSSTKPEERPNLADFENISEESEQQSEAAAFAPPSIMDRFKDIQRAVMPYLVGGLFVLLLLMVVAILRRRSFVSRQSEGAAPPPQLGFYLEIKRLLQAAGVPNRASHTPGEYRVALEKKGLTHPAFDELIEYVYAVNYCDSPREAAREKGFVRQVKVLVKQDEPHDI